MDDRETFKEECRLVFDLLDRDHSGFLEPKELGDGLRAVGSNPTKDEIDEMIKEGENTKSGDGKLNFEEFFNLITKHRKPVEQEEYSLMEAFKCFDKNGDGRINKEELKEALTTIGLNKLSEDEANDLFKEVDIDGNGHIEYKELVQTILK